LTQLGKQAYSIRVLVNADDFGLNSTVNKAITDAFEQGLISSTTMITNMSGFEEACEIAKTNKLVDCIGVHLNLMEGQPLTNEILGFNRLCNESGFFNGILEGHISKFTPEERKAVTAELIAQIEILEKKGIKPTHIDSHHHFHNSISFFPIVLKVALIKNIKAIRLNINCYEHLPLYKKLYKLSYNTVLFCYGMAKTDYLCAVDDIGRVLPNHKKGILEVIVHPTYSEENVLIDSENKRMLSEQLKPLIQHSRISYATLRSARFPKLLSIK